MCRLDKNERAGMVFWQLGTCPAGQAMCRAGEAPRCHVLSLLAGFPLGRLRFLIRSNCLQPGLTISAKFRRNFGKFSVSASYRDPKFRYFSVYFVFKFKIQQISTEIQRNSPKFTEILERNSPKFTEILERNFVSAKHRDFIGKRNG